MSRPLELRCAARRFSAALLACLPIVGCFDPTEQPEANTDAGGGTSSADDASGSASTSDGSPGTSASAGSTGMTSPSGDDASTGDATDATASATDASSGGDSSSGSISGTDPGTDEGTTTGGLAACDGQCAPEVPQGWQGPVIVYDGTEAAPPCPGDFPQLVHADQHAGLDEGAAVCDCDCGEVLGASCGAATLREEGNNCVLGVMNPDTYVLQPNACTLINAPAHTYSLTSSALQTAGASCSPQATEQFGAPSWDRHVRSCGTTGGDACEGGTCFPTVPADHAMCIFVQGEAACPGGPWSQVLVSYATATDERDCTACTCGTPTGSCGGDAYLTNSGCADAAVLVEIMPAPGCAAIASATHGMWVPEVDASCAPSGGTLTGDVEVDGAVTYCCL